MVCNLTGKNYNRYFIDLIRVLDNGGTITAASVAEQMARNSGDSTRFPDDKTFRAAITDLPLYGRLSQAKVRAVLEALDSAALTSKSEVQPLPPGLTIEHVMPQAWTTHWSLAEEDTVDPDTKHPDPLRKQKAIQRRDRLVNTLGNLTLITGSLNPALSNSPWNLKRPELLKFSKLNLTQYFHGTDAETWDESAIEKRTEKLFEQLGTIWPALPVETANPVNQKPAIQSA